MKNNTNISWFSIIEVLVGIFIFTLGLISIYLIMVSSLKLNDYNKNQIIASNLAREQIELIRNVRDSNYNALYAWDSIPGTTDANWNREMFIPENYYMIQNTFWVWDPISIVDISWMDESWAQESEVRPGWRMESFRLCLDPQNRYIYCPSATSPNQTPFYKYLKIESSPIDDTFEVVSKVIWYKRWYHDLEIRTLLADWKRL